MVTTSRILNTVPRSHLYRHMRHYHQARPGHSSRPQTIVSGIQEQEARDVPGDMLAEWDIMFHPATDTTAVRACGDVVACRTLRRARHSRTSVLEDDSHPVILLAVDVPVDEAGDVWRRVLHSVERGGTLSDILIETDYKVSR